MFIATRWNPIYWNTACLIVNSASLEDEYDVDIDTEEVVKKDKSSDYAKIAKALGEIISRGIKVSLVDINKSNFSFEPDVENNQILFGMKALNGIGTNVIEEIIENRPYHSLNEFIFKCPLNKTAMISLIKSGAFDQLEVESEWAKELGIEPRYLIMSYYLNKTSDLKKKLTLSNLNGLIQKELLPEDLDRQEKIFRFNKYLKSDKTVRSYYILNDIGLSFCNKYFEGDLPIEVINGVAIIDKNKWDKIYKKEMDKVREWLTKNQQEILKQYNEILFLENWNKYAKGSISAWEMESLCFYYNEHELANVNVKKYGIDDFFLMPEQPVVDYFFKRNGKQIPIYKTYKIIGTVISKNDTRSSVSILTTKGVVNVKFTKEYFAMFNRQISEVQDDGVRKVREKGWFTRGTKIMVTGFRREDTFVAKSYANTPTHQLYKIVDVDKDGNISIIHERYKTNE